MLRRSLRWMHQFEDGLMVAVLFLMIVLTVAEIVMRNMFSVSVTWIDPILRNGVLWIALLGTMVASRRDEQIRIDVASHYFPENIKRVLSVVLDIVTAGVCLMVAYFSAEYVLTDVMKYDGNAFGSVPAWLLQIIIPVGFASIGARYCLLLILNLQGRRPTFDERAEESQ